MATYIKYSCCEASCTTHWFRYCEYMMYSTGTVTVKRKT